MHRLAILVMTSLLGFAIAPSATRYLVRPDGTGDYPTFQAAIVAVVAGDTVALDKGM